MDIKRFVFTSHELDNVCNSGTLTNDDTFRRAGFEIISLRPRNMVRIARHPCMPGYIFKVYLNCDAPGDRLVRLYNRCVGAERILNVMSWINQFGISSQRFRVPSKRLYRVSDNQYILVAKDMKLVSAEETLAAWKQADRETVRELYYILREGCGSHYLAGNIPYTRRGKFAFIDTEHPQRTIAMDQVKQYLSPAMQAFWGELQSYPPLGKLLA